MDDGTVRPRGRLHPLSDVDPEERTAWCAGCQARVGINKENSSLGWRCGPANSQRAKAWLKANAGRAAETKAAYRAADPERFLAMKRASSSRYAEAHLQEIRDKANAKRERQRTEVIEAYGGHCNCPGCHVIHAALLTIDHIEPAHHRRTGHIRRSTRDIYREIIKLGFPPDFQLLCGSCNLAKGDRGKCPLAGEDH